MAPRWRALLIPFACSCAQRCTARLRSWQHAARRARAGGAEALAPTQVLAPVSWARRNLTLAPVDVTETCGQNAAGHTVSLNITPNATQLSAVRTRHRARPWGTAAKHPAGCSNGVDSRRCDAPPAQANAAGAAILVPGSSCVFQTTEDYYQGAQTHAGPQPLRVNCCAASQSRAQPRIAALSGRNLHTAAFADRMTALLSGATYVPGVIMGEGFDGKIPELMTTYLTASGSYAYRYTAKPTCILYKDVRFMCLLTAWFLR